MILKYGTFSKHKSIIMHFIYSRGIPFSVCLYSPFFRNDRRTVTIFLHTYVDRSGNVSRLKKRPQTRRRGRQDTRIFIHHRVVEQEHRLTGASILTGWKDACITDMAHVGFQTELTSRPIGNSKIQNHSSNARRTEVREDRVHTEGLFHKIANSQQRMYSGRWSDGHHFWQR